MLKILIKSYLPSSICLTLSVNVMISSLVIERKELRNLKNVDITIISMNFMLYISNGD